MAAVTPSPSGFSYAQAAKGRSPAVTAQTPASKVTSGAGTPATGAFSELTPGGNWADDVEASVDGKSTESQKPAQETGRGMQVKESAVERAKSEDKTQQATSGVSSPDLAASSSTTTKDDDSSTAPTNGSSSETTWETKSQTSEPAWIAERKERQSSSQNSDNTVKGEKKGKESPLPAPPKPVVLQPAAPPTVNPWMKRAEETKAKLAAHQQAPKLVASAPSPDSNALKENQRPRADSRKKAISVAALPRHGESPFSGGESRKGSGFQGKRASEARLNNPQQGSRPTGDDAAAARPGAQTRASLPNPTTAPPPVKDQVSWPTPNTNAGLEKDRREVTDKDNSEKQVEDVIPAAKSRKKPEWQSLAVTPNIIFETPNIRGRESHGPPTGERGGRGGLRGRGGYRGGPNAVNGGDRSAGRIGPHQSDGDNVTAATQRGRSNTADREAMPPPANPNRASSESSRRETNVESRPDRSSRGNSLTETRSLGKSFRTEPKLPEERKAVSTWVEAQSDLPRTKSPSQFESSTSKTEDEERIPEPIPRRNSVGTQTEENGESFDSSARGGPPIRMVPSESRKEQRSFDSGFKEHNANAPPRGAKRGGRGRGSREFSNGHQANHTYGNGDFAAATAFGVPSSPSYSGSRGNHQSTYPQPSRGGWSRGNPRAQSIPNEGYYSRFGNPYAQSQLPNVQTYMPGMYDFPGYPMTAMPYQPYMDHQYLMDMVTTQLEYYFSIDNLLKDMFLRKNMDSQGFVFLNVIAAFNRIKQLTLDKDLLRAVCINSETIEIRVGEDGQERLRKREGWDQFLLPIGQREPSARNDGPQQLQRPEKPPTQVYGPAPNHGPQSVVPPGMQQRFDRRSYDAGYSMVNDMPPQFAGFPTVPESAYAEMMNGDDVRGRTAKSPIHDGDMSPSHQPPADDKDNEPDAFPDDQISALTVVVKLNHQRIPFHSAATRTFSNGSIDSRSIMGEMEKADESAPAPTTNGETLANGADSSSGASRHASPSAARSNERAGATPDMSVFWMKEENAPSGLQKDMTGEPYVQLRLKALDQRNHAATGTCPYDLDVLYQFWCHFLIRNFNSRMYTEFKYYATQDGKERHNFTGLQALVRFHAQALLSPNPIRDRLVKDYVELINNEPPKLEGAAFKQLRSTWRNGALNLKNRKKLADTIDESLKERLET